MLSDGLIEHFINSEDVVKNHIKYLKKDGVLILAVPNIKKSWMYNKLSRKGKIGYAGYRHVSRQELRRCAKENNMRILFCGYVGVFNIGLVNTTVYNGLFRKMFTAAYLISDKILEVLNYKKESRIFSPYIYLIAKKNEDTK